MQKLDMTLKVDVPDIRLRTIIQYSKHSLADLIVYIHNLQLYETVQPHILNRLERGAMILMCIHREFGKSTMVEDLAFKELAFNDDAFVVIFCKSDDSAYNRVNSVKRYFEMDVLPNGYDNPFKQLVPQKRGNKKYKWSDSDFVLADGNRCMGGGAGKGILGVKEGDVRPTLIIIDDPVDPEKKGDDRKMIAWLRQTIMPLGGPMTRIIMIGTPRRFTDIIMVYLRDKRSLFEIIYRPAVYDDGSIMCKEFWLRKGACCFDVGNPKFQCNGLEGDELIEMHIVQTKRKVGSLGWATEYLLKPMDDATSMFPMKDLEPNKLDGEEDRPLMSFVDYRRRAKAANDLFRETGETPERIPCVIGVDLAISESEDADFSVFTVYSAYDDRKNTILHGERWQGKSFKELKAILRSLYQLFRPDLVKIEDNGWQIVFAHDMHEYQTMMPISGHTTHTEKHSSTIGIPSMKALFENVEVQCPYGDTESQKFVDELFHELHGFNYDSGQVVSITEHDDTPMSLWMAIMAAQEMINSAVVVYEGISFNKEDSFI